MDASNDSRTLRTQYLAGDISHHDYYMSIANRLGMGHEVIGGKVMDRVRKSADPHYSDIPLEEWDNIGYRVFGNPGSLGINKAFKWADDRDSLAGRVCLLKAIAREAIVSESLANPE